MGGGGAVLGGSWVDSIMEFELPGEEKKKRREAKSAAKSGVGRDISSSEEEEKKKSSELELAVKMSYVELKFLLRAIDDEEDDVV